MRNRTIACLTVTVMCLASAAQSAEIAPKVKFGAIIPLAPLVDTDTGFKNVSFDSSVGFDFQVEKYFAIGFESGLNCLFAKARTGDQRESSAASSAKRTNVYTIPFLFEASARYDKRDTWGIMLYITPGIGYGLSIYDHPDSREIYHGYAWQIMGGIAVHFKNMKALELLIEAGYRGTVLQDSDNHSLELAGMVFQAGLSFPLEVTK